MLLKDSPCVQNYLTRVMDRTQEASFDHGMGRKWPQEHAALRVANSLRPVGHVSVGLPAQRMRSAWGSSLPGVLWSRGEGREKNVCMLCM